MRIFAGINKAPATQGGQYIKPGNYVFRVRRCLLKESTRKKGVKHAIAELETLHAEQTDESVKPNAVGTAPSFIVVLPRVEDPELWDEKEQMGMGNLRAFLLAAFGSVAVAQGEELPDEDDIGEEEAKEAYVKDGLVGTVVTAEAFNRPTKDGGDFTRINWFAADAETQEKFGSVAKEPPY